MAPIKSMKLGWHIAIIGLIGATCYFVGKASVGSKENLHSETATISVLSERTVTNSTAEPALAQARSLLASKPTEERTLAIKHAVLGMTLPQLESLWNTHRHHFDYHDKEDAELAASILTRMAALDPQVAMDRLSETSTAKYAMLPAILRGWAQHDLDGALAWIQSSNDPRARHGCMTAVIEEVGMSDREAAFDLFAKAVKEKTLPGNSWDSSSFFSKWVREDPEQALAQALKFHESTTNPDAVLGAMVTWSRIDGKAASEWLVANTSSRLLSKAYGPLLDGWVETAPRDAADFLLQLEDKSGIPSNLEDLLAKWSSLDSEDMNAWANDLTDPAQLAAYEKAMERANQEANREIGLDSLKLLNHPDKRESFLREAEFWAEKDPFAALEWGEQNLKDSEFLDEFNAKVIDSLSRRSPGDTVQHLAKLTDENGNKSRVYARTAEGWGNLDPQAARAWVEQLEPGKERDAAIVGLAEGWLAKHRERVAADAWISQVMPESGQIRDQLLNRLAYGTIMETGSDESARAIAYAQQIENPYYRDQTFEALIKNWSGAHDRYDAAIQFARESDLISDTVRWRVLDERNLAP